MMRRRHSPVTDADCRAVTVAMFRQHGHELFGLPPGPVGAAVVECHRRGWMWLLNHREAMVTVYGRRAVEDYLPQGEPCERD